MRTHVLTALITAAIVLTVTVGMKRPGRVEAQASDAKANLISAMRQDATDFTGVRAKYRQHKARYDALGFTWADGDFTGENAGLTAAQFTTGVGNLENVFNAYDSGGTLSAGFPTTIELIAR